MQLLSNFSRINESFQTTQVNYLYNFIFYPTLCHKFDTMLNQHKILRVLKLISYLEQAPTKSISHLAEMLDSTDRTVYRYFDLIRECGFDLQRDEHNRFYIVDERTNGVRFTQEEAQLLKELILKHSKQNKLKDSLLTKIYLSSEIQMVASHLVNAKNGKVIERLALSMGNKEQVILRKYQSINSETISDRLVEPFGFTDNYQTVMAYEIDSKKNKTFNIDRITYVDFTGKPFKNSKKFKKQVPDVFGFSYSGKTHSIDLELSLKDVLLLKDQYPQTTPFIHYNHIKNTYQLKVQVNDMKPIERFMRGISSNLVNE
jgi:predicted DNA-binding transcriptional regulator YafY